MRECARGPCGKGCHFGGKGTGPPPVSGTFLCFGCFETPKLAVSILKQTNRNKRLVLDSAETSFGSSFDCFDTKLVLEDTQPVPIINIIIGIINFLL